MKVLIIEDEHTAAKNLKYLLSEVEPSLIVERVIDTVSGAIAFFNHDPKIELIFMDIHLADGISFEIFERTKVKAPVIFTTAYDEYALKAFKVNSIDYLLKPINEDELRDAIEKFKNSKKFSSTTTTEFQEMLHLLKSERKDYKNTYLVQQRDTLYPLRVDNLAYFIIDEGVVKAVTKENQSYVLEKKMDDIEAELDPNQFIRANRQFIVQRSAIENLQLYFNRKLILNIHPKPEEQIIVSKEKAPYLKKWINAH
ncbi:LytTR family DNA-binding domain-containing protein [Aquimarina sp. 2201CG5-10]|uniref:LytR/AlgR family response regulator transcription factor n=1 Tax=Aquimarina callyspongiae TaxID=3098150 RepID=UPI002AB4D467|nr:LytTR family DNA-binding domain-containing protein [Aquimarina sp. 2201CG5-10]MDY8134313.1 LytTR family DNA-binding domain-containing protein [Aquimarina sp. 2201CG5-10]